MLRRARGAVAPRVRGTELVSHDGGGAESHTGGRSLCVAGGGRARSSGFVGAQPSVVGLGARPSTIRDDHTRPVVVTPARDPSGAITIRPATTSDQEHLGRYGGALMRQHHAADPARFIQVDHPEAGYGRFLVSQLSSPDRLVMVAERSGVVVGYVFADIESTNWMELRGPCGVVHDIYVDEAARHLGAG